MQVGIDITSWSNPRGYGRFCRGLVTALLAAEAPHGFTLFVDAQTHADPHWPLPGGARQVVVPTSEAPSRAAAASSRRSLPDMWAMGRAVSRAALDVFFIPTVYAYYPVYTRAPILLGVHDTIPEDFPRLVFPDWHGRLLWRIKAGLAHRQARYVVTVSEYARASILRRFGHRPDRVWVVGEAPDTAFRPVRDRQMIAGAQTRQGLAAGARYIACLGGLNPHKNLGMLLGVLAELRQNAPTADVQLLLIGPAESDTFTPGAAAARQAAARLGLEGAVHFTGYLPDEEAACLLNGAQALALPSLAEGFGLAAVEAAACGTPVVATRNSPLPELLEGGGLFIDPRRPDELRAALTTLLTDEARRQQMAAQALERARRLTWPKAAEQFLDVLAHIANAAR